MVTKFMLELNHAIITGDRTQVHLYVPNQIVRTYDYRELIVLVEEYGLIEWGVWEVTDDTFFVEDAEDLEQLHAESV